MWSLVVSVHERGVSCSLARIPQLVGMICRYVYDQPSRAAAVYQLDQLQSSASYHRTTAEPRIAIQMAWRRRLASPSQTKPAAILTRCDTPPPKTTDHRANSGAISEMFNPGPFQHLST